MVAHLVLAVGHELRHLERLFEIVLGPGSVFVLVVDHWQHSLDLQIFIRAIELVLVSNLRDPANNAGQGIA